MRNVLLILGLGLLLAPGIASAQTRINNNQLPNPIQTVSSGYTLSYTGLSTVGGKGTGTCTTLLTAGGLGTPNGCLLYLETSGTNNYPYLTVHDKAMESVYSHNAVVYNTGEGTLNSGQNAFNFNFTFDDTSFGALTYKDGNTIPGSTDKATLVLSACGTPGGTPASSSPCNSLILGDRVIVGGSEGSVAAPSGEIAFYNNTPIQRVTVTGVTHGVPGLTSLLSALGDSNYGLIHDTTTAGDTNLSFLDVAQTWTANQAYSTLTASEPVCTDGSKNLTSTCTGLVGASQLAAQYTKRACSFGLGDGVTALSAATYPSSGQMLQCVNNSGVTWTITGIHCLTDNAGTSTINVYNNAGTSLLTAPVTCNATKTSGGAAGTQSGTTTIATTDGINFVFVADGTSKYVTATVDFTE